MSHANLTARYRPQTFADLAGQDTVRAILSRAAAEDKVAPAYLFSGTRGVGKTTLARVFAKALNCVHAPAAEPCNECERCRQITLGTAVDVVEIDGASNRGIDDVRRLKEVVGYAPMDGRYKVFIIDEAHMLSRDAFNALLKTLEEPPARVTFIMATTESHKFPPTILSRCQHYVFKRLSEQGLEAHLRKILTAESVPFDASAVRLLTRRAAGSVRDAMSLLGQVLALGGEKLTEDDTRRVLGLAGQELLFTLLGLLREGNTPAIVNLVREMLDSGLDLGFFLRELALCWRTLFVLRQADGAAGATGATGARGSAAAALELSEADAVRWQAEAAQFSLAHIHAAWQMTLDGQRRVMTSLEPALALELLLLNIAMLPRLLPLEDLSRLSRAGGAPAPSSAPPSTPGGAAGAGSMPGGQGGRGPAASPAQGQNFAASAGTASAAHAAAPVQEAAPRKDVPAGVPVRIEEGSAGPAEECLPVAEAMPPDDFAPADEDAQTFFEEAPAAAAGLDAFGPDFAASPSAQGAPGDPGAATTQRRPEDLSWSAFLRFCGQRQNLPANVMGMFRTLKGVFEEPALCVTPAGSFAQEQLNQPETKARFLALAREYYGADAALRVLPPPPVKSPAEIKEEVRAHPAVQLLEKEMGARLIDYGISFGQDAGPLQ